MKTVEDLIQKLAQDRKAYGELLIRTQQLEDEIDTTERRLRAQIVVAPGGKLFHEPTGMVYGIQNERITILESIYSTKMIELSGPYNPVPNVDPALCTCHDCRVGNDTACMERMVVS